MDPLIIEPSSEADAAFNSFLDEQIYEFNSQATGVHDGRRFAGIIKDASGNVIAAINGHTRGASCYVAHLWVHESQRGHGIGSALLRSAEQEAILRGCVQKRSSLPTPSKPPEFYERLGYVRQATIPNYP
jgi:GNAT superfamily N-acetyltransferase